MLNVNSILLGDFILCERYFDNIFLNILFYKFRVFRKCLENRHWFSVVKTKFNYNLMLNFFFYSGQFLGFLFFYLILK